MTQMIQPFQRFLHLGLVMLLASQTLIGCASNKKTKTPAELASEANQSTLANEPQSATLNARVQAISRKNRILTLKFPDEKVAKVRCENSVTNFDQIGVGDNVSADFLDDVEVYSPGPNGKPIWDDVKEIKKAPKGTRPGSVILRPYEYTGTVQTIDLNSRRLTLKGIDGKTIRVTGNSQVSRFAEIKPGDKLVARFLDVAKIRVSPPEAGSTANRPARRR